MFLQRALAEHAKKLDRQINTILRSWQKSSINMNLDSLVGEFIKANQGGKKIRGFLVKLGYELAQNHLGGVMASASLQPATIRGEITKIGAAYEIFHAAILAHDDIIDKSKTRRGKPSLYQSLGGGHYGISQAICLGDIGFFLATKIIAESDFADEKRNQALQWFSQTMLDTAVGEMLDVELSHLKDERKEEDVIKIMQLKTAQYTISGPLILGAILAGLSPTSSRLRWIKEFGENLGIAFQIQDDILDITSDIEEGKNTLLITQALKKADAKQLRILKQYYGKGDLGDQGLEEVRKVFLETGALDYSSKIALQYAFKAKKVIPKMTKDIQMIKLLEEMIGYLVERTR